MEEAQAMADQRVAETSVRPLPDHFPEGFVG